MNRLRDGQGGDNPLAAKGINILRNTPPAPPAAELKRRVWMSLQQANADMHAPKGYGMSMLGKIAAMPRIKTFAMVMVLLCAAGSAGAVIANHFIAPDRAGTPAQPAVRSVDVITTTKRKTAELRRTTEPTSPGVTIVNPVTPQAPAKAAAPSRSVGAIAGRAPRPVAAATGSTTGSMMGSTTGSASSRASLDNMPSAGLASARERTEVLDAMVALRRDHNPIRAGALLARYLAAHPHGALHEEALVLAIEAADARGDHPSARSFARVYQQRYPKGRFRHFAHGHAQKDAR